MILILRFAEPDSVQDGDCVIVPECIFPSAVDRSSQRRRGHCATGSSLYLLLSLSSVARVHCAVNSACHRPIVTTHAYLTSVMSHNTGQRCRTEVHVSNIAQTQHDCRFSKQSHSWRATQALALGTIACTMELVGICSKTLHGASDACLILISLCLQPKAIQMCFKLLLRLSNLALRSQCKRQMMPTHLSSTYEPGASC